MFMLCVHLLTELLEQTQAKGMYFIVVNNLNHIMQNIEFRLHFLASQHNSLDVCVDYSV